MVVNDDGPRCWKRDTHCNPYRGRFSCSVKPDEPYDLAVPNVEADGAYCWALFSREHFSGCFYLKQGPLPRHNNSPSCSTRHITVEDYSQKIWDLAQV